MLSASSSDHHDIAQVTGADGEFVIARLSEGDHEVLGVHDVQGKALALVYVEAGQTTDLDLHFAGAAS